MSSAMKKFTIIRPKGQARDDHEKLLSRCIACTVDVGSYQFVHRFSRREQCAGIGDERCAGETVTLLYSAS